MKIIDPCAHDNLYGHPQTPQEAVEYARRCVRALLAGGYSQDQADEEIMLGSSGPKMAGYQIARGKISVPRPDLPREDRYLGGRGTQWWEFSFRKLAAGLEQPQQAELW